MYLKFSTVIWDVLCNVKVSSIVLEFSRSFALENVSVNKLLGPFFVPKTMVLTQILGRAMNDVVVSLGVHLPVADP